MKHLTKPVTRTCGRYGARLQQSMSIEAIFGIVPVSEEDSLVVLIQLVAVVASSAVLITRRTRTCASVSFRWTDIGAAFLKPLFP